MTVALMFPTPCTDAEISPIETTLEKMEPLAMTEALIDPIVRTLAMM